MTATEQLDHFAQLVFAEEVAVRKEFTTLDDGAALVRRTGGFQIEDAYTIEAARRVRARVAA